MNTPVKVQKDRPIKADTNLKWSDKQRLDAVNSYLLLGNLALTSRILAIPEVTLRVWKTQQWWKDAVLEIKNSEKMELTNRVKKLVNAAMTVVEDRLVNGDFQYDQKTGQVVRKPVNMKDAHKVAVDMVEKQTALEKTEQEVQTDANIEDKLLLLAGKFADMATKKIEQQNNDRRTIDVSDVEEN